MMFMRLLLCGISAILLLAGCRTETTASGDSCYGISDAEKEQLVELARQSLRKPNSVVTPEEYVRYIKTAYPEIKMRYTGDRFGTAKLHWTLPNRKIAMVFTGDLMTPQMQWNAEVVNTYDEDDIIYQNVPGKTSATPSLPDFRLPGKK